MNLNQATFENAFGTFEQLPASDQTEIAFSGRSNVGKSSLLNRLFGRKSLARVSSVPGKTITINFYKLDTFRFVDLPGYGYAKVPRSEKLRWAEMMEGYFSSGRQIKLVVQLIDMRHPPTKDDLQMFEFLRANHFDYVVAMTKADKLKKREYLERLQKVKEELPFVPEDRLIPFSSETGEGAQRLKDIISQYVDE